jgi:hypothetical protein
MPRSGSTCMACLCVPAMVCLLSMPGSWGFFYGVVTCPCMLCPLWTRSRVQVRWCCRRPACRGAAPWITCGAWRGKRALQLHDRVMGGRRRPGAVPSRGPWAPRTRSALPQPLALTAARAGERGCCGGRCMRGACCPRRGRTSDTRARRGAQLSLPIPTALSAPVGSSLATSPPGLAVLTAGSMRAAGTIHGPTKPTCFCDLTRTATIGLLLPTTVLQPICRGYGRGYRRGVVVAIISTPY